MVDYVNTLSKFGTKVPDRNKRTKFNHLRTRYRVLFEGFAAPIGGDNISMDMKSFNTPKGKFAEQKIDTITGEIWYPGLWTWDPVSFVVYNSYDNANYKELMRQLMLQKDISTQVSGTVPQNYKFVTKFEHTDGDSNPVATWVMEGCWLVQAQPDDAENGNHDSMIVNCSMRFDNAALYDADGTLITGGGAVSTLLDKIMAY